MSKPKRTESHLIRPGVALLAFAALIGARELHTDGSATEMAMRLSVVGTTPRYVVPLHFLFLGFTVAIAAVLAGRLGQLRLPLFYGVALAAAIAQAEFQSSAYQYVAPLWNISHESAWRLAVAMVRECRAANLPVPNVPTENLVREFTELDFRAFEPLFRHDLPLPDAENLEFVPWSPSFSGAGGLYEGVPSLRLLERKLRVTTSLAGEMADKPIASDS